MFRDVLFATTGGDALSLCRPLQNQMGGDKSDKKEKKEKKRAAEDEDEPSSKKQRLVSPIANPLADEKLSKKVLKCVKAAAKDKLIRRGVKEVVKALKKGEKGLAIIAGDISPVEVIAHVPILCEEKNIAYIYVPSKEELGLASLTKRPTSIVMVRHGAEFADSYAECEKEMRKVCSPPASQLPPACTRACAPFVHRARGLQQLRLVRSRRRCQRFNHRRMRQRLADCHVQSQSCTQGSHASRSYGSLGTVCLAARV